MDDVRTSRRQVKPPVLTDPVRLEFSITASDATTEAIPFFDGCGGNFFVKAGSAAVTFTFWGAAGVGDTYYPLYDSSNMPVTRTVAAGRGYLLPDECFGCGSIKIVGNDTAIVTISYKG